MLKLIKNITFIIVSLFVAGNLSAQDIQISQYYAVPTFLNPAFTGLGDDTRVGLDYRNQWGAVGKAFTSSILYGDHYFGTKSNISAGALIMTQSEGYGRLRNTEFSGTGAYTINLGEEFAINTGLQLAYGGRGIDYSRLDFGDQYSSQGLITDVSSETLEQRRTSYFDVGAGLLLYGKNMFIGASMHHIPKPDVGINNFNEPLNRKFSAQGGFRIAFEHATLTYTPTKEKSVVGIFNYKNQGDFSQFDIGTYFIFEPAVAGIWYRGIPLGSKEQPNESVVGLVGFHVEKFAFAYSYDFSMNRLRGNGVAVHEISMTYEWIIFTRSRLQVKKHNVRTRKTLPCSKFLK